MGCGCKHGQGGVIVSKGGSGNTIRKNKVEKTGMKNTDKKSVDVRMSGLREDASKEAIENGLKQCYLCAKKHLVRAQILFEEYHTGYPDHIKNLIESLRVSELRVKKAFLLQQRVMGHLDMAANELLGNDANAETMNQEHINVANSIREARLKLSDNPLAVINFDSLLMAVQMLQQQSLQ